MEIVSVSPKCSRINGIQRFELGSSLFQTWFLNVTVGVLIPPISYRSLRFGVLCSEMSKCLWLSNVILQESVWLLFSWGGIFSLNLNESRKFLVLKCYQYPVFKHGSSVSILLRVNILKCVVKPHVRKWMFFFVARACQYCRSNLYVCTWQREGQDRNSKQDACRSGLRYVKTVMSAQSVLQLFLPTVTEIAFPNWSFFTERLTSCQ